MTGLSNRDILLRSASMLFRQKGYDGVGLNEILTVSGLPKGSLYYHFPGGKRELAQAAMLWVGEVVEILADRAFAEAQDFTEGAIAACHTIAKLAKREGQILACPVMSILLAAPHDSELRIACQSVLSGWTACLEKHAVRFGTPAPHTTAELLVMQLEGAWILALAEQSVAPFERLAKRYASQDAT